MADDFEDPEAAASRLEAALERIARLATVSPPPAVPVPPPPAQAPPAQAPADGELSIPEIAERLDALIGRLRAALGKP